jgi:hypothetical protein
MAPSDPELDHEPDPAGGHRVRTLLASVQDVASSLHRLTAQLERELEPWPDPAPDGPPHPVHPASGGRAELDRLQAELDQLRAAQEARVVIEQAKGMLMASRRCSDRQAFELLVGMSQAEQRKVRDIAAELVAAAVHAPQEAPGPADQVPGRPGRPGQQPGAQRGSSPAPGRPGAPPARRSDPPTPATVRPGRLIDLDDTDQSVSVGRPTRPR